MIDSETLAKLRVRAESDPEIKALLEAFDAQCHDLHTTHGLYATDVRSLGLSLANRKLAFEIKHTSLNLPS